MSLKNFPSHLYNDEVLVARDGNVVTITISNEKAMNTFSLGVTTGVLQALEMCADDTTVMVVVLTGAGDRAFCAGGNLVGGAASGGFRGAGGKGKPPPTTQGAVRNLRSMMVTSQLLRDSHFVSIAAVNGACAGAGLSWACACDLRLAAENALFRSGFIGAGLSGDFGGTWTLPRVVGPAKARDLYLLNEKVRAEEAVRIGLASKLIPARGDAFKAKVHEIALTLAASAPLALKRIKANLIDADSTSFAHHLDLEAERHGKCGFHGDAAEAGMAFLEKRVAHFTGVGQRKLWEASKL